MKGLGGANSIRAFRRTLVADDFVHLLVPAMLSVMVDFILELADSIIAGNMLGDKALAGVTLCQPFFSFFLFVQVLILTGTAVLYSESIGSDNRNAANKFFGQGVILSLAAGAFITLASLIFKYQILNFLDVPKDIDIYADTYFSYLLYLPLFIVYFVMYAVVMNDGGKKWCNISSIALIVLKIVLSIVLCKLIGIGGLCLGTYIGLSVGILFLMFNFFEKNNKLKFVFFFNLKESLNVMKFGFSESFFSLCVSGIYMFFNWFLLENYDGNAIIIFTMVMSLLQLCVSVSDGINEAVQPIIEIFRGEGNFGEIAKTMSIASYISSLFLVPAVVIIFIGARCVPSIFGVNDPSLQTAAVEAIRIFMLSALFLIGGLCFCTYMLFMEHFVYSILNTLFVILMLPFVFIFGTSGNVNGVWAAMSISVVVGLFIILLLVRVRAKKYNCVFPWLIDKK
ncbi:MAG: MATE family efflux transporter [Bacteroidales bacterium]|jgi:Na+-driven multidrug efflux pump|nr:MATE family efflux transporter [Bacteroidales bacterium]